MMTDLRTVFRKLAKSPGFAFTAILTLALGLGANTAIFSLIHGVLLRPLPFPDSEQLVTVRCSPSQQNSLNPADLAEYQNWKTQTDLFAELAVYYYQNHILGEGESPRSVFGHVVSANYFSVLRVRPALGRAISEADCLPNAAPVVVLSDALWRSQFAGDPTIVGRTIRMGGQPAEVIGVMPAGFVSAQPHESAAAVLTPQQRTIETSPRGWHYLQVIGRLQSGVSVAQAAARMREIAPRLQAEHNHTDGIAVIGLHDWSTQDTRGRLLTLMGAVGLVLLIACANLANLQLVRITGRTAEISVRMALGASRWQIARSVLLESFVVGAAGGLLGVGLAAAALQVSETFLRSQFPFMGTISLNATVLAFSLGLTLLAVGLSALVPAWRATSAWSNFMRSIGRSSSTTPQQRRLNHAFIVAQVAVTLLLLVGAGLLLRSMQRLLGQNLGFNTEQVQITRVTLPQSSYPEPEDRRAFFLRLTERLQNLPGVESVAMGDSIPLSVNSNGGFAVKGLEWTRGQEPRVVKLAISPDYFRTFGIRLVQGREFNASDRAGAQGAVIVNEAFVRKYLADGNPLGREVRFGAGYGGESGWDQVVGVVADARIVGLDREPEPTMYSCYLQTWVGSMQVALRTPLDTSVLLAPVRAAVRELDRDVPVTSVRPMEILIENAVAQRKIITWTIGVAAIVALSLAVLGLYSIIAYTVAQQTRDIGIRMALGAAPDRVSRWVVSSGVKLVALGALIGLIASVMLNRVVGSMLFGVNAWDPLTYFGVAAVLMLTALFGCWLPARRAARIDPLVALRAD